MGESVILCQGKADRHAQIQVDSTFFILVQRNAISKCHSYTVKLALTAFFTKLYRISPPRQVTTYVTGSPVFRILPVRGEDVFPEPLSETDFGGIVRGTERFLCVTPIVPEFRTELRQIEYHRGCVIV